MSQDTQISMPLAKASASIAAAVGAQVVDTGPKAASAFADLLTLTWPNLAAFAAFLYTVAMLIEFCWKKFWRPVLERWGWIKAKPRRVYTEREIQMILAERDSEQAGL